jgi:hypothetical protein
MNFRAMARSVIWALATMAACSGAASAAAWTRVEADRFIVYGATGESAARSYAAKLTIFDLTLRTMNPQVASKPKAQKLEVFLLRSRSDLRAIWPDAPSGAGGFYRATPERVYAVALQGGTGLLPDAAIFHEYAHHFMFENLPASYPAWVTEGWAEYYASAALKPQSIEVGNYDEGRTRYMFGLNWLPMSDVLTKNVFEFSGYHRSQFYAQAWLLMHYMRATNARADALNRALVAIGAGVPSLKAFEDATGMDMPTLTRELQNYRKLSVVRWKRPDPPAMTVSALSPAQGEFLLDSLRLSTDSGRKESPAYLADLRRRAGAYPGDRAANLILAQAEFAQGDPLAAEGIIRRLLAVDEKDVDALRIAALGQIRVGERQRTERPQRFKAARAYAARAYQLRDDDPRILYAYAYSRTIPPSFPSENDLNALMLAWSLAPSVQETAVLTGVALVRNKRRADGIRLLERVANNPHGGSVAAYARRMIAQNAPATTEDLKKAAAEDEG